MIPITEAARGRWRAILPAFGIGDEFLSGKHGPCPMCGGRDRWRFDDKGDGCWFCTNCGAGKGMKLIQLKTGLEFKAAAEEVAKHIGTAPIEKPKPQRSEAAKLAAMKRLWDSAVPLTPDNPAGRYIANRTGLRVFPKCLRYAAQCAYRREDGSNTPVPALLGLVQARDGSPCNIQRTYLNAAGFKSELPEPKRTMEGSLPAGAAVRLLDPGDGVLGVAEGIETALSAAMIFNVPVWSTLNSLLLERWSPPPEVRKVIIFADCDASYTGQAASYALAKRLVGPKHKLEVEVQIPDALDVDWNDVLGCMRPLSGKIEGTNIVQ